MGKAKQQFDRLPRKPPQRSTQADHIEHERRAIAVRLLAAGELLADSERLSAMAEAMLALAKPDAADIVAEELMALARA